MGSRAEGQGLGLQNNRLHRCPAGCKHSLTLNIINVLIRNTPYMETQTIIVTVVV